jgi:hypothetical protein
MNLCNADTGGLLTKNIMNKTTITLTVITLLGIVFLGGAIYIKTRPAPLTGCDVLLLRMLESKTQDERDYSEQRWTEACIDTDKP